MIQPVEEKEAIYFRGKKLPINKRQLNYSIPMVKSSEITRDAIRVLEEERSGKQLGLLSRWSNLNRSVLKYFRFGNVCLIAGISGSGKSYILNMLLSDFTNPELNKDFEGKVFALHFGYEMSPTREALRYATTKLAKSYSYLLSSKFNNNTRSYNILTDVELDAAKKAVYEFGKSPIFYAQGVGTTTQMYITTYEVANRLEQEFGRCNFIVSNDHTLLNKKTKEDKNEIELLANAAQIFIKIREDFDAMVLPIGQLNGNIETSDRKRIPEQHYPIRTDIHGSNQIYMACDDVFIFHSPEKLNIVNYGSLKLNTERLIHCARIKARFGEEGQLWFRNDLDKGLLTEAQQEDFLTLEF